VTADSRRYAPAICTCGRGRDHQALLNSLERFLVSEHVQKLPVSDRIEARTEWATANEAELRTCDAAAQICLDRLADWRAWQRNR
jgi:hypothetical protein